MLSDTLFFLGKAPFQLKNIILRYSHLKNHDKHKLYAYFLAIKNCMTNYAQHPKTKKVRFSIGCLMHCQKNEVVWIDLDFCDEDYSRLPRKKSQRTIIYV